MAKHSKIDAPGYPHFITGTIHKRINLFQISEFPCQTFIEELAFYREKFDFKLLGYVLMPDHYHLLILPKPGDKMRSIMSRIKGYAAHEIVNWLKISGHDELLTVFRLPPECRKRRKDAEYKIFQHDEYDYVIPNREKLLEKLRYIHANPERWGLVENAIDYKYSSCRTYELGDESVIRIDRILF